MEKKESEKYIFNYNKGSSAERDIEEVIRCQETCHRFICKVLDVTMDEKINYFLCESPNQVGLIYGDNIPCNGFASRPNNIYVVYNEDIKCIGFHEDVHIISYNTLGVPESIFIREGLAMFFDRGYFGISNYSWVSYFIKNNMYVSVRDLVIDENFHNINHIISYTISGAFVDYLLLNFGVKKFKSFYSNMGRNFEEVFFRKFKRSLEEIESNFIDYVEVLKFNENMYSLMEVKLE